MKRINDIILFFILLTAFSTLYLNLSGQKINRYNTFKYNVNEGLLQSHVIDMTFDQNNFGWLSFENGIQKFDGEHFINVDIQPGLPDDKNIHFFKSNNGTLYASHAYGISEYKCNSNSFIQVYSCPDTAHSDITFLGEDDGKIYFFNGKESILGIRSQTGKIVSNSNAPFDKIKNDFFSIVISDNIINHTMAFWSDSTLIFWNLQQGKALHGSRKIDYIHLLSSLHLKNDHEVLYYNNNILKDKNTLVSYNYLTAENKALINWPTNIKPLRSNFFNWQNQALLSYYNHIYQIDEDSLTELNEIVNLQNKPVAGNAIINKLVEDNFGNLYVLTINDGFRKLVRKNYAIKYYGTDLIENNYIISICADKNANRIIAGTYGNGLLVFDTMQQLIKHVESFSGQPKKFSPSGIIKTGDDEYIIFLLGQKNAWRATNNFTSFKLLPFLNIKNAYDVNYYGNISGVAYGNTFFQSSNSVYKIYKGITSIQQYQLENDVDIGGVLNKNVMVVFKNNQLMFLDTVYFNVKDVSTIKNTGGVRCMAADAAGNIFIGANKGLFKTDARGKLIFHLDKENGLPDECIYAIALDGEGHIWCSSNKGIFKVSNSKSILQLKKEDGLQENEFNSNVVALSEDGELFFGGVNGISSFFPTAIKNFAEKINVFVTDIKINNQPLVTDTAVWKIKNINLPYDKNALSFDFIAMSNNNPGQYVYQYKMEGIDDQWIQNNSFQTVRYYLQPGKYIFKIYASRFFNKDALPMQEIYITITPPFWKTWWFIALLIFTGAIIIAYSFNRYNKYKFGKQLRIIESEKQMQQERERISRDLHDNIGAYANAILYNTELLENEVDFSVKNKLMNDLKFASKDIISSLRETIWAFKKDYYSSEECLIRIRNFIQALSRYYPKIIFKINANTPEDVLLPSTVAFNIVRIVQEAVTNAIKHSGTLLINIESTVTNKEWLITVTDTGKGFEQGKISYTGNGLHNMEQRAKDAGLNMNIISGDGTGTTIKLIIKI